MAVATILAFSLSASAQLYRSGSPRVQARQALFSLHLAQQVFLAENGVFGTCLGQMGLVPSVGVAMGFLNPNPQANALARISGADCDDIQFNLGATSEGDLAQTYLKMGSPSHPAPAHALDSFRAMAIYKTSGALGQYGLMTINEQGIIEEIISPRDQYNEALLNLIWLYKAQQAFMLEYEFYASCLLDMGYLTGQSSRIFIGFSEAATENNMLVRTNGGNCADANYNYSPAGHSFARAFRAVGGNSLGIGVNAMGFRAIAIGEYTDGAVFALSIDQDKILNNIH